MKTAVIGIGSNSVRMLLAEVTPGGEGRRLERLRAGTRLFAGLDEGRRLSGDAMGRTAAAVAEMAAYARKAGAEEVRLFATSATRDAANSGSFAQLLRASAQVELIICSGEEEALLSFLGAKAPGECGVLDIGGGSTEVVTGDDGGIRTAFSCQMGAVRLFRELPLTSEEELEAVIRRADGILTERLEAVRPGALPAVWRGTGGTFTTLAAMVRGVPWTDRTRTHGTAVPLADAEAIARQLAPQPLEERLRHPGLQPNRADIVVHGIAILIACMRRLGIPEVTVSEYGNLDGFALRQYRLTALA